MTSLDVNERDSLATLAACADLGVNFLDTAYCYGAHGESEKLIAQVLGSQRDQFVIATKCGLHWNASGVQVKDGRPATLRREVEESLTRLRTDRVELLYLHAPDPDTPVEESAGELLRIMQSGQARSIGVSNFTLEQWRFAGRVLAADEGPAWRQAAARSCLSARRRPLEVSHVSRRRVAEKPRPARRAARHR
jgi:aryl-alcohol dehydrogenase-like predicted oxidoreductase